MESVASSNRLKAPSPVDAMNAATLSTSTGTKLAEIDIYNPFAVLGFNYDLNDLYVLQRMYLIYIICCKKIVFFSLQSVFMTITVYYQNLWGLKSKTNEF